MLHKTRGIVINYIRYRETSVIVKIYTEEFGIQTYIENGVRSAKSKNKIALFQPLTLLDLVIYHKEGKGIQRISEIKCNAPFQTIPFDIYKSSIALFITEILSKSLHEETTNPHLFHFLHNSILWLDGTEEHFENFHLQFLLRLGTYLGFSPENAHEISHELNLHNLPVLTKVLEYQLDVLMNTQYDKAPKIDRFSRNQLLDSIILFYRLHVDTLTEVKSLGVLHEVMR
ncbi:DNA replication and repair protein RecO [Arcicella aurantiaca]|uniref:DNA repair protein RecO n=1 Tax=Arcicella aurantiaca TaxID=591202 RepID=A0A316DIW6_9BACT|nr:DNA repair protein RecO [Arcicella aurantiaca]PWK17825.1 DNA replication and repair protein RecO [Arcicella aurantiaca]